MGSGDCSAADTSPPRSLRPDDIVRASITGLGELQNTVINEESTAHCG
jgi:2-keto-4-pentenoate hydratase/2-oxohepta-3-ene-1,7-dioic acid hydratase in catechol pathway